MPEPECDFFKLTTNCNPEPFTYKKAMEIRDNTFQRQFETHRDGKLITVEYSLQERKIFLTRIGKPEGFDDEEFIDDFIRQILGQSTEKRLKVVPTFPRITSFFRKNPAYKELLPLGIKI